MNLSSENKRWRSVPFTHPTTFDTVMINAELKNKIRSDLENFRIWKRSFLLYGPSGIGKTSFVAAMARFLSYDGYDIDMSKVANDSNLKMLLLQMTPKSLIVVEDLDRFWTKKFMTVSLSDLKMLLLRTTVWQWAVPRGIIQYELALHLAPDMPSSVELRSICHLNSAVCFSKLEKYEDTIKECRKALELNPSYMKARLRRAEAHEKLERFEEAIVDMKSVLELDPSNDQTKKAICRLGPLAEEKKKKNERGDDRKRYSATISGERRPENQIAEPISVDTPENTSISAIAQAAPLAPFQAY